jgi:polar amino acid transport system substrate-binding protein
VAFAGGALFGALAAGPAGVARGSPAGAGGAGVAFAQAAPQAQEGRLRVVTKELPPFVIKEGGTLSGFSIDLWAEVARRGGYTFDYVEVPTVGDLLDTVSRGDADVGIAGISMTADRENQVDFTVPMFNSGLQILVADRGESPLATVADFVGGPFLKGLLRVSLVVLLVVIVLAHLLWLVERRRGDSEFALPYPGGVAQAAWWMLATMLSAGDRAPTGVAGRVISLVWMLGGIVLISLFTAAVTSQLTVQGLRSNISSVADLPGKKVVTVQGSTSADYLTEQHIIFTTVTRVEDAYPMLERGQADAVVYDSPVLLYYAATSGKGKVQVVGQILRPENYGIAVPTNSPLRKELNRILLDLAADGTYQDLYDRWFTPKTG